MENDDKIPSLRELKRSRKPVRNANVEFKEKLSSLDHFAIWITNHIGAMGFFSFIFAWTMLWLLWNTLGPRNLRFDPYPAFVLWLFISNMIQLFLMPLIMIGQNLQGRHAEARAEADFEVNTRAEKEIETILRNLEYQNGLILEILRKMETK